jgi:hypothetical protein
VIQGGDGATEAGFEYVSRLRCPSPTLIVSCWCSKKVGWFGGVRRCFAGLRIRVLHECSVLRTRFQVCHSVAPSLRLALFALTIIHSCRNE